MSLKTLVLILLSALAPPDYESSRVEDASDIDLHFLSKTEGEVAILDETYEPYFSQLQRREIAAFVQEFPPQGDLQVARAFAREKFAAAVSDFTSKEKRYIKFVLDEVVKEFEKQGNKLFVNHPWKLIKIENWLCGGFAHTRGDYIILSQKHLDHLSGDWSENMTKVQSSSLVSKLGGLLVHEQMHALQRNYKEDFAAFYASKWAYVQANIEADTSIILNQVSNPDAPVADWLIKGEDKKHYWIRTLLKATHGIPQMGKDFINKVYLVEKKGESNYVLVHDQGGRPISTSMATLGDFTSSFPEIAMRGIDHPNEVSAYMMSAYFQALFEGDQAFSNEDPKSKIKCDAFIEWVNDYMHNHNKSK